MTARGSQRPQENYSGVTTSPEARQASLRDLSGQTRRFPAMWWSPSDGQWFSDVPGEGLMAFGAVGSREDSLPKDAQRLVPVGPLLELARHIDVMADGADARAREASTRKHGLNNYNFWAGMATAREQCAKELRERVASLLGESPEPNAQEGWDASKRGDCPDCDPQSARDVLPLELRTCTRCGAVWDREGAGRPHVVHAWDPSAITGEHQAGTP